MQIEQAIGACARSMEWFCRTDETEQFELTGPAPASYGRARRRGASRSPARGVTSFLAAAAGIQELDRTLLAMRLRVEDGRRRLAKLLAVAEKLVEIGDRAHEAIGEGSVGTSLRILRASVVSGQRCTGSSTGNGTPRDL